jgi:hypothetical protein
LGLEKGAAPGDAPLLTFHFDHASDPSISYRMMFEAPPLGPLTLAEHGADGARLLLARAAAIDAALIGAWRVPPGTIHRADYSVDALELRRDGSYVLRLAGGVVRPGHWSHQRGTGVMPLRGTLVLDPLDVVFAVERWEIELAPGASVLRFAERDGRPPFTLHRSVLDPLARSFVAHWRFVGPAGAGAPQELVLRHDGEMELIARPGAPRAIGHWSLQQARRAADRVEAVLILAVHVPGHAPTREQWPVQLPFAPGAELHFAGAPSLRYRRLFR